MKALRVEREKNQGDNMTLPDPDQALSMPIEELAATVRCGVFARSQPKERLSKDVVPSGI